MWGHSAIFNIFAWSGLILDQSHTFVCLQSPAACATLAGDDSDHNFENYDFYKGAS